MFDIGWTEILILATISLFVIGPKEIPKFLGFIGKMIAKVRGISRDLQDSVDDAIKNSELEDIRKEISFTDPELSKNFNEIINPGLNKEKNTNEDKTSSASDESIKKDSDNKLSNNEEVTLTKESLPTGLKHIKDNEEEDDEIKSKDS
jgi:sec-independent protein translocase protein TatB